MNDLAGRLKNIRDEIDRVIACLPVDGRGRTCALSENGRMWAKSEGYPNHNQLPSTISHTIFMPGPCRTLENYELAAWMDSHKQLHWIIEAAGESNLCGAGFRAACVRARMAGVDSFLIHALISAIYHDRYMPDGIEISILARQLKNSSDPITNYYLTSMALMEISTGTKRISQRDASEFFDPFPLPETEKTK